MNDQTTKMIVFAAGAALIYLFARKSNVFGGGTASTGGGGTGNVGTGSLISQIGGTTSTGGTMGGTTGTTGVMPPPTHGGLNPGTSQDIYTTYNTKPYTVQDMAP